MRIGIYAQALRTNGGVYRYTLRLLEALRELESDDEFVVLHGRGTHVPVDDFVGGKWSSAELPTRPMDLVRSLGTTVVGDDWARRLWYYANRLWPTSFVRDPTREPHFDARATRWHRRLGLDLVLYPAYSVSAFETRVPSIVTVHDLNHRLYTEFPEVSAFGEFERREYYFRNVCRTALTLLVDSDTGRDDLLTFYADTGVKADHVVVLPMLPASTVKSNVGPEERANVRHRYALAGDYFFYPAQFWPHKNHLRLIEALSHLKTTARLEPTLALSGSYAGSLRRRTYLAAMRTARRLGVERQVRYLGFVPDEDMSALYAEAVGLVMPTFFGPTNIPVLEAFAAGCPVVTSNLRGIRQQVNGAAVLVDPRDVESIAEGLRRLLTSPTERTTLVQQGQKVLARYTPHDYRRALGNALTITKVRLRR